VWAEESALEQEELEEGLEVQEELAPDWEMEMVKEWVSVLEVQGCHNQHCSDKR
jgi:hypothetical protein